MKIFVTKFFVALIAFSGILYAQFDPTDFEGFWRGTWFNNTFMSTDSAFLSVTIDQGASALEAVLDLDGNVFGGNDPDPVTLFGTYDNNGFSAMGNSSTYGDIFLSGDAAGNITGRMPNVPNPAIDSTTLSGTYTETNIDLTYIVYFTGGGGTADGIINLVKDPTSGVEKESDIIPDGFVLKQNYPNPFNPSTTFQFSLPEQTFIKLEIINAVGEKVDVLLSEELTAGTYRYEWNAENLTSGIYFYSLTADNFRQTRKLILLK
jgi:hypothetical protein